MKSIENEEIVTTYEDLEKKYRRGIYDAVKNAKSFDVVQKKDGKISNLILDRKGIEDLRKESYHLCKDCHNGYVTKCPKIRDLYKRPIEEYDFINEGFQVLAPKPFKSIIRFLVTDCENFESDYKYVKKEKLR